MVLGGRASGPSAGSASQNPTVVPTHPSPPCTSRASAMQSLTCRHVCLDINSHLLTLFNFKFPLPNQQSWTVFHQNCAVVTLAGYVGVFRAGKRVQTTRQTLLGQHEGSGGNGNPGACTFWVGMYPWREYNLGESSHFLSPYIHEN